MESKTRKCGFYDCPNQIKKQEGYAWPHACDTCLYKYRKSLKCDACGLANTRERSFSTIPDFSDAITGENKIEKEVKRTKETIAYQKEIIQKFLSKNISSELRQELNLVFQGRCELEKNISDWENLTREYWEKYQACRSEFVRQKGGQQFNIYEYFLCDNCHQKVTEKEAKIEHDYQDKGLNKLGMNEEIFDQIAQEIGGKETDIILWTSGKNALYSEEEFEKYHKGVKENLIKKLKEERNKLNASQIERLEAELKFYNDWEIPEKNFVKTNKNANQSFWIISGIGGIVILAMIIYFAYRNRKNVKK